MPSAKPFKIPESVLVVIHTPDLQVLLIERADHPGFWQSVTGSKDSLDEPAAETARREVLEETGFDIAAIGAELRDWQLANVYDIYPQWRHRYAPDVMRNTEHVFGLQLPSALTPTLAPHEHLSWVWLPWAEAADRCFSPSNAEAVLQLPRFTAVMTSRDPFPAPPHPPGDVLRVATYNIHKGVRGLGPAKRLEIHNLQMGVEALDADLVCLQEVRLFHHREAAQFDRTWFGWPEKGQAEFLAPEGYEVAYRTNAVTKGGEHGNALLSRWPMGDVGHHDVSDHSFEQRGLLHVPVHWHGTVVHVVVAHFGLIHSSRLRQVDRLAAFVREHVPEGSPVLVAGDFNDWGERLDASMRLHGLRRASPPHGRPRAPTFPSRLPVFALDRVYTRGLRCTGVQVPRGPSWARMSDHLPLVVELALE